MLKISILLSVLFLSISSVYAETAEDYLHSGQSSYESNNYDQAILDFTKAIEIDPKNAEAYNIRGNCFLHQGNSPQAFSAFTQAIDLNPRFAEAYYNRAFAYYIERKFEESLADANKAKSLGDNDATFIIGVINRESGSDQ